jgi:hypothetical protein
MVAELSFALAAKATFVGSRTRVGTSQVMRWSARQAPLDGANWTRAAFNVLAGTPGQVSYPTEVREVPHGDSLISKA